MDVEFRINSTDLASWRRIQATPEAQKDGSVIWFGHFSSIEEQKFNEQKLLNAQEEATRSTKFIQKVVTQVPGTIFELLITQSGDADFLYLSDSLRTQLDHKYKKL